MTLAPVKPEISIIAPLAGPSQDMRPLLDSLFKLDNKGYEAIVVLHGPEQDLARAREMAAEFVIPLRVLSLPPCPAGAARNFGAEQAQGSLLFFTETDCALPPELLSRLQEHFQDQDLAGVGLACSPANPQEPLAVLTGLEIAYDRQEHAELDTLGAAFRRGIFMAAGSYDPVDESEGLENFEFSSRLLALGHSLLFDPECFVKRPLPSTWGSYLRLAYHLGRNRYRNTLHRRRLGLSASGGWGEHAQSVLALLVPSLPLALWQTHPEQAVTLPLICLLLLYPLNRRFIKFVTEQDPGLVSRALLMCLLRPFAWTAGLIKAALDHMGGQG
jgi:glycosyltransferase involved in cell wall biosynthesis